MANPSNLTITHRIRSYLGRILLGEAEHTELSDLALDIQSADVQHLLALRDLHVIPDISWNMAGLTDMEGTLSVEGAFNTLLSPETSSLEWNRITLYQIPTLTQHQRMMAEDLANIRVGNHLILADLCLGPTNQIQWVVSRVMNRILAERLSQTASRDIQRRMNAGHDQLRAQIASPNFFRQAPGLIQWDGLIKAGVHAVIEVLKHPGDEPYQTMRSNTPSHMFVGMIDDNERERLWDEVAKILVRPVA